MLFHQSIRIGIRIKMVLETVARSIRLYSTEQQQHQQQQQTHLRDTRPTMIIDDKHTFENAVVFLNRLQSNAKTVRASVQRAHDQMNENVQHTVKYMERSGITVNDLDRLKIIHVSGTKGKGSTCAFTESILRSFGIRTGFFSSPHLVCVTERIRINGQPISKAKFTKYFWKVYDLLDRFKDSTDDMPPYFKFLTVMSFHVFLAENVDVAIIEVGIGGEYDCTNVMRNTQTVGITSLGLEHTNILGTTLSDIAWQKAGIIKCGTYAFTVKQPDECNRMLSDRAAEKMAHLHYVPDFDNYNWSKFPTNDLLNNNKVQRLNASLAIQISYNWLRQNVNRIPKLTPFLDNLQKQQKICLDVPNEVINGLEQCIWNGRFQIVHLGKLKVFIDGAHTMESLQVCLEWFKESVRENTSKKCLLFNVTGDRNVKKMLPLINSIFTFDLAFFSPNVPTKAVQINDTNYVTNAQNNCSINCDIWNGLSSIQPQIEKTNSVKSSEGLVFECTNDVLTYIEKHLPDERVDLLVTGSIHLIGALLNSVHNMAKGH